MRNQDWYDLGDKVQKIVQDAVNSRDFRQLNENITQTLNRAVRDGTEVLRNVLGQDWDGMPGGPPPVRRPRSYRESRQVYREQTAQRPPAQVKQERLL